MTPHEAAQRQYARRKRLVNSAAKEAHKLWREVDRSRIAESWRVVSPRLAIVVAGAQLAAARPADEYLDAILSAQDIDPAAAGAVNARALAGVASDGRDLETLLDSAPIATYTALGDGRDMAHAMASGLSTLDMIVRTQVADAGRVADSVAMAARRRVGGYVRMVVGATCARCIVLAGDYYRWNQGFQRHPRCDCIHIPTAEDRMGDLRTDPKATFRSMSRDEQDRVFTKAGAQAIRDGANMNQVVNARRGMRTVEIGRRKVQVTTEGTTKRGFSTYVRRDIDRLEGRSTQYVRTVRGRQGYIRNYAERRVQRPRLTPDEIYRVAPSRDEAIRLLARNGYITNVPGGGSLISDVAQFASNIR